VRDVTGSGGPVGLIDASFGGGISAFFTARHPGQVRRLVLFNPLLDYKKRFIDDKPDWDHDQISKQAGQQLAAQGSLAHSPTFTLGRALLSTRWRRAGRSTGSARPFAARWRRPVMTAVSALLLRRVVRGRG
jgi:pimeloyl-ACP methyl ester carboxylesterase